MGVDIPVPAVESILQAQVDWVKNCEKRSTQENLHKRNQQKKAKRVRHEREKAYMETLGRLGSSISEYVGDGQGEADGTSQAVDLDGALVDADSGVYDLSTVRVEESSDNAKPLFFLYDCETTEVEHLQ